MSESGYVHGYSFYESSRLQDQAATLSDLLHHDTRYPAGARVLEAGCGVGAQTELLVRYSPGIALTSIDISPVSLEQARSRPGLAEAGVAFMQADIFHLPFPDSHFDHVFLCFVLEHMPNPEEVLAHLRRVLKTGGTLTVIEGDHGSTLFHPESRAARAAIDCLVQLQARSGGNALIGRELPGLLRRGGFRDPRVSPRMVYADASRPEWVEGFTRRTFIAMVEGVEARAVSQGLATQAAFRQGLADLRRTTEPDGFFGYTFFKGVGVK